MMETLFITTVFVGWGLAILFSIISTIVVWKTENKVKWASWSNLGFMWVLSILFGWVLGIPMLIVMLDSIDKHKPHP